MLDHKRQHGKQRLLIISMNAGKRYMFSRGPSVRCFATSNPSLMKPMNYLYETVAPFGNTNCSSSRQ